jgi:hypothetical protein
VVKVREFSRPPGGVRGCDLDELARARAVTSGLHTPLARVWERGDLADCLAIIKCRKADLGPGLDLPRRSDDVDFPRQRAPVARPSAGLGGGGGTRSVVHGCISPPGKSVPRVEGQRQVYGNE